MHHEISRGRGNRRLPLGPLRDAEDLGDLAAAAARGVPPGSVARQALRRCAPGLLPNRLSGPLVDTVNAVPPVLAALLVTGIAGSDPWTPALAVAVVAWSPLAMHTSSLLRQERATLHLTATRALGPGRWYLLWHELLPAVLPPVVRHALLRLPGIALSLAALGFLGLCPGGSRIVSRAHGLALPPLG
jgi:peptide/nickel transport system permease protein